MRKCKIGVVLSNKPCEECKCRQWLDYEEDLNCTLIAVDKHGPMTLREVGDRLGISFVRVKQLQDTAIAKLAAKNTKLKDFSNSG
jgi:DNA-directed RNA polymerase sigma subunit (sigma70/sigma32)